MLKTFGFGSGSARSFSTHLPLHYNLENLLAKFLQREKALLFSSGFQLNSTLLRTLGKESSLYFLDQRCHRSLLEGALTAPGRTFRFRHNDPHHLETLLKKHRGEGQEVWIVTESLFSMEGDRAPLQELISLKQEYEAFLIVDEAHSIGVLGEKGAGISPSEVDLVVGAFGKALGGFGGFIAGDALLIDFLSNFSPGFMFTTSLPPSLVGGLIEAVKLLPTLEHERAKLKENTALLRKLLNLEAGDHIVPYFTGTPEMALSLSKTLSQNGWKVPAVRPPTVAPNCSLLRFSMTSQHKEEEIRGVTEYLLNIRNQ